MTETPLAQHSDITQTMNTSLTQSHHGTKFCHWFFLYQGNRVTTGEWDPINFNPFLLPNRAYICLAYIMLTLKNYPSAINAIDPSLSWDLLVFWSSCFSWWLLVLFLSDFWGIFFLICKIPMLANVPSKHPKSDNSQLKNAAFLDENDEGNRLVWGQKKWRAPKSPFYNQKSNSLWH